MQFTKKAMLLHMALEMNVEMKKEGTPLSSLVRLALAIS